MKGLLDSQGLSFSNVVKTTVFLDNMDDFTTVNGIYAEYFVEPYPARSAVEVAKLPKGALIEVEVIAKKIIKKRDFRFLKSSFLYIIRKEIAIIPTIKQ